MLAVDDDEDLRRLVDILFASARGSLLPDVIEFDHAADLASARARIARAMPDLILLDLDLPDGDGSDFCAELRAREDTRYVPVIVLSASRKTEDKVKALSVGADDYLVKPFASAELCARVGARLRRAKSRAGGDAGLEVGPIRIDLARQRAFRLDGESWIDIGATPGELRLLHQLLTERGASVSRERLLEALSPDAAVTPRAVDTHLANLRAKLGPLRAMLVGVRGVGYRFEAASEVTSSNSET